MSEFGYIHGLPDFDEVSALLENIPSAWLPALMIKIAKITAFTDFKRFMFGDIVNINFMHQRRNECFQMMGKYDGSASEECKRLFREEYEFWDALIRERDAQAKQ